MDLNEPLSCFVAGVGFAKYKSFIADMKSNDPVELVAEPENTYDPNAVRLEWKGQKIGYVPKSSNAGIAAGLKAGKKLSAKVLVVDASEKSHKAIRVGLYQ